MTLAFRPQMQRRGKITFRVTFATPFVLISDHYLSKVISEFDSVNFSALISYFK